MHANRRGFRERQRSICVERMSADRLRLSFNGSGSVCIAQLMAGKWTLHFCESGSTRWHDLSPAELLHILAGVA